MNAHALKLGFNALGFQAAWWLTVAGIALGFPLLGPLVMTLYLFVDHFSLTKNRSEVLLILAAMLLGTLADTVFSMSGLLTYAGGYAWLPLLAPLWITAMWGGFAATLNHSLGWIRERFFLAVLLGAVFGPLSYVAGTKFGAIQINGNVTAALIILGIFWGAAVPGLVTLGKYLENRIKR